jgi:hypothetical protein
MSQPSIASYFNTRKRPANNDIRNKSKVLIIEDNNRIEALPIMHEEDSTMVEHASTKKVVMHFIFHLLTSKPSCSNQHLAHFLYPFLFYNKVANRLLPTFFPQSPMKFSIQNSVLACINTLLLLQFLQIHAPFSSICPITFTTFEHLFLNKQSHHFITI